MVTEVQEKLLQKYYGPVQKWRGRDIGAIWRSKFDYISLLALRDFFQPETIEVGGRVILRSPSSTGYTETEIREGVQKNEHDTLTEQEIIDSWNWMEIACELGSVYPNADDDILEEAEFLVAEVVREAWDVWLHYKYPDRSFNVRVIPPEETGEYVGVGFVELKR